MAKQAGPFYITGCYSTICFYRMDGNYYARLKSSLEGKRVKKDPVFKETMRYAGILGQASKIASILYRALPKEEKKHGLFRKLTGQVMQLLKKEKTKQEILEILQPKKSAASKKLFKISWNGTRMTLIKRLPVRSGGD